MDGNDRSAEQKAWEIAGYSGELDILQLDPDSRDAATFERALAAIEDLQRRLAAASEECDQWKEGGMALAQQSKDLERENERLNGQVAEWSKANLAIVAKCVSETKRADKAQRERSGMRTALKNIARECSSFPIRDGLAFRCEGYALAALQEPPHEQV